MDSLQFIASLVGNLAWPLTVVGVVLLMHKPLLVLLPTLESVHYRKLKVEFGKQLTKAEVEVSKLAPLTPAPVPSDSASEERFAATATVAPNLAVLQAWLDVEAELKSTAIKAGIEFKRSSPLDSARAIQSAGLLDKQTSELIRDLRIFAILLSTLTRISPSRLSKPNVIS